MRFSPRIRRALLLATFLASCSPSYALDPHTPIAQYVHTSWTSDAGLAAVRRLNQTPDGYLWLATRVGLKRFDGVRFSTYSAGSAQGLESSTIQDLLVNPDGSLWIATLGGGISRYQRGTFRLFTTQNGLPTNNIESLFRDRNGTLWAGGSDGSVSHFIRGRFKQMVVPIPPVPVMAFVEDREQSLWIATWGSGVFRLKNGILTAFSVKDGLPDQRVAGLYRDHSGTIWTAGWGGISFWNGARFIPDRAVNTIAELAGKCLEDRNGNLWITSSSGLIRVHAGQISKLDRNSGLSDDFVSDVFEDREGNLWVATRSGLDRLRDGPIRAFLSKEPLMRDGGPVVADGTEGIWMIVGNRMARLASERETSWPTGLPHSSKPLSILSMPGSQFLIGAEHGGVLWGTHGAAPVPQLAGLTVRCLLKARDGGIWIATAERGLLYWPAGSESLVDAGVPDRFLVTLAEDGSGGIWAGSFYGGGLYYVSAKGIQHFGARDGLPSSNISTLFVDEQNTLWIGSANGLSWFEKGRIRTVSSRQGLQSDLVWAIVDDAHGRLWFAGYGGIESIEKKRLADWAAGSLARLTPRVYRRTDGLQIIAIDRPFPNAVRSRDGSLWFCITDGVLEVKPQDPSAALSRNFRVVIEDATIDGAQNFHPERLAIPHGARSIEVRYTALTLSSPETVRFRYRLEGFDNSWVDAADRRVAYYSNLEPGTYTFSVQASAGEDAWVASPPLFLEQKPFFYQTKWFLFIVCTTAAALIVFVYRLRMRVAVGRIEARLRERTRIARELHDTLLQSFQGSLLRFQTASRLLQSRPAEAQRILENTMDQAQQALIEGRNAVEGLRSSLVEVKDLPEAIRTVGEELAANPADDRSIALSLTVGGVPRPLPSIVSDEVYRIASEALRNAFQHAGASRIEVELDYGERHFELRVRDDGRGIDAKFLSQEGERPEGHFGLRGMRERAYEIGGTLTIWSALGSGAELELSIPALAAYGMAARGWRSWLARRFSAARASVPLKH